MGNNKSSATIEDKLNKWLINHSLDLLPHERQELRAIITTETTKAVQTELQALDNYMYSDQGVTDLDLVQDYVRDRLKALQEEQKGEKRCQTLN